MAEAPEYSIEYAKSNRSACVKCKAKINKDEVRIGKLIRSSTFDGKFTVWHHSKCILEGDGGLQLESLAQLQGLASIRPEDAKRIESSIQVIGLASTSSTEAVQSDESEDANASPSKKRKVESTNSLVPKETHNIIQEEIRVRWLVRDSMVKAFGVPALKKLAERAGISPTGNTETWIFKYVDRLLYGKEPPCPACKGHTLEYNETQASYICHGNLDAWSKCAFRSEVALHDPQDGTISSILPLLPPEVIQILKVQRIRPYQAYAMVHELCQSIKEAAPAATVEASASASAAAAAPFTGDDPESERGELKRKVRIKAGGAIEEETGLADKAHVHEKYTATLNMTDVTSGHNSFYMLQLLKEDNANVYHLYRKWGRIGTDIKGSTVKQYTDVSKAVKEFETIFRDKTGNAWSSNVGQYFRKISGKFNWVQTDYSDVKATKPLVSLGDADASVSVDSSVPDRVKTLLSHWFDVKQLEAALQELEIDTNKLPLGKLSRASLQKGFDILASIERLIKSGTTESSAFISLSNQFYTQVPHIFPAQGSLPLIQTEKQIKEKTDMVQALLDMEVTSRLMAVDASAAEANDPFAQRYAQLKTDIVPLDKDGDMWKLIHEYVANTHPDKPAGGWGQNLAVEDVYTINIAGADETFKSHANDPNRQLLWHSTRHTNVVSILSSGGLKVSPPGVPISGSRCGRGIYTASALAKSSNYCFASQQSNIGYIFLAEVALGKPQEILRDRYVDTAPVGFDSTHALGVRTTDPAGNVTLPNGVKVPKGNLITRPGFNYGSSSFSDDEFIIHSADRLVIRYMLRVKFNY